MISTEKSRRIIVFTHYNMLPLQPTFPDNRTKQHAMPASGIYNSVSCYVSLGLPIANSFLFYLYFNIISILICKYLFNSIFSKKKKKKDPCLVFVIGYKQSQVICNFKENRKGTGVGDDGNIQHAPEMTRHANVGQA